MGIDRFSSLTLVYLYWDPANVGSEVVFAYHRNEIAAFAKLVDGDASCRFVPISYPEHWDELGHVSATTPWLASTSSGLPKRYLIQVGAIGEGTAQLSPRGLSSAFQTS